MLKLGEIDTSPYDDFPLGKFLLVALVVIIRTEECRVIPHLSASLRLLRLRWLSRALALCPRGSGISLRRHQRVKLKGTTVVDK